MLCYCFFCIHESTISSLKIRSLKTVVIIYLTATGSPPFNFKCFFYAFYLRAGVGVVKNYFKC